GSSARSSGPTFSSLAGPVNHFHRCPSSGALTPAWTLSGRHPKRDYRTNPAFGYHEALRHDGAALGPSASRNGRSDGSVQAGKRPPREPQIECSSPPSTSPSS